MSTTEKGVFLDLDHTIVKPKSGGTFPQDSNDFEFIPGILQKLIKLKKDGYKLFLCTNQAGIDQGYQLPKEVFGRISHIESELRALAKAEGLDGDFFADASVAWHKDHHYYKPSPLFIEQMVVKHNLNKEECFMVGDASGLVRLSIVDDGYRFTGGYSYVSELSENVIRSVEKLFSSYKKIMVDGALNGVLRVIVKKSEHRPKEEKYVTYNEDFSDSDKKFAENGGIKYIDIDEFLKNGN